MIMTIVMICQSVTQAYCKSSIKPPGGLFSFKLQERGVISNPKYIFQACFSNTA